MTSQKIYRAALIAALIITGAVTSSVKTLAQSEQSGQSSTRIKADDATGLEVQLYLIVGTKTAVSDEEKLPSVLDGVAKQLRSTFTFKNYRLAATLLNRVKNGGRFSLSWAGGPLLASSAATPSTPGFNDFQVSSVKLVQDDAGRDVIQMVGFNFGARLPIQVSSVAMTGTSPSAPIIQYERTGMTTDLSMREGEPTIVGTLNVGPSGEALIIVVSARRPASR